MAILPEAISLTLCERFEVNPTLGQVSLVGVFQALRFPTFPSSVQRFIVYCGLYGGEGEGTIELTLSRFSDEKDLYSYKRWLSFPGRPRVTNLIVPVTCAFPLPERYSLALRLDEEVLTRRFLEIFAE